MTRIATSWLVYRLTGSALLLGFVGFAGQIPTFLLAPFAGVLVDRIDRRKLLVWTQVLAGVQSLALAALTLAKVITIHEILALSVFQGLINAFDMPGRQSFLVQMVAEGKPDKQDLGNAIALNSSIVNLARLIGPRRRTRHRGGRRRLVLPHRRRQLHRRRRLTAHDARPPTTMQARARPPCSSSCAKAGRTSSASAPSAPSSALRASQPDGNAVHGAHADLRLAGSARRRRIRSAFSWEPPASARWSPPSRWPCANPFAGSRP